MDRSEATRLRLRRALRLPALLIGMTLLLTACVVPVVTPFGDITFVVCDYDDLPLEGVLVQIGNTVKTTDEDGYVEFGTVELPYTATLYDPGSNYIASYQNVVDVDLRLFVPFSTAGTSAGAATFDGAIDPVGSGSHEMQIGATVDGRAFRGTVDSGLNYRVDTRWRHTADVSWDLYAAETSFTADPDVTPGVVDSIAFGYANGTVGNGDSLGNDLEVLTHPSGFLTGTVASPPGMTLDSQLFGAVVGSVNMGVGVPFLFEVDRDPSTTITSPIVQVPSGWDIAFAYAHHFSGAQGETLTVSTPGLDFGASSLDIAAAQLGTAFLDYDDGDSFDEGDSVGVGSVVQDTTVSVRFDPVSVDDPTLWLFSDSGNFTVPDLTDLGVSLPDGAAYHVQSVRYSWSFATMITKLADPFVLKKGISSRLDLTVLRSAASEVTVGGGGGGPPTGGTPPSGSTFYSLSRYALHEGMTRVREELPATVATQASSCPQVSIAATGGSVLINACTGDELQSYDSPGQTFYDAVIMPVPDGETGDAGLFQSGDGLFLAPLDANGAISGFGQIAFGNYIDNNPIGDDPANGVSYVDANFASIAFTVFDGGSGVWTFDDTTLQPSDLNDGGSDNWARSAIVNPARDALLVVANRMGAGMQLLYVELDGPIGPGTQSVTSVSVVGPLGSDPRRIRCDFASERCAVSDRADDTLTIVSWDGGDAASITGTANVAEGPVGIDVLGDRVVSAGYDVDQVSIVSLNGDGTVAGVSTTALPSECNFPGHAVFLDDPGNAALVSCNGDGSPGDPGGYVYIPGAF